MNLIPCINKAYDHDYDDVDDDVKVSYLILFSGNA